MGTRGLNDFVLKFANVNGTGSASANGLVAKSLFRMGIPIGPKNIFPSNIQGLPTWFEIRVNAEGHVGRRGGVDLMVAMNPQSMAQDIAELTDGGFLLYDSTRRLGDKHNTEGVTLIELPITRLCADEFPNPKSRSLLKNVVYVGALMELLKIDQTVVEQLIQEQFASKAKLIPANLKALQLGSDYAKEHLSLDLGFGVERMECDPDRILVDGNTAAGLGCVYGGATVASWYPITPSTSLVDAFDSFCHAHRVDAQTGKHLFGIVQAEDEIASIGMVLGANWNGARAFTATSGPGISLMSEFLGYAYYAEIPAVVFNVQRVGPSTGMPTRTQQADLLSCAYASHGDTKHVLLFPSNPAECFTLAAEAFDIAERLQTPVIVLSDINLGMNDWVSPPFTWDDTKKADRGKVLSAEDLDKLDGKFFRYLDQDGDGVCARTLPGTHQEKGSYFTRGSGHDRFGRYTENSAAYQDNLDRLSRKIDHARSQLPGPVVHKRKGAKTALVYLGTSGEVTDEALSQLASEGHPIDQLQLRSFPFGDDVRSFIREYDQVFVLDQNRDRQLHSLLVIELGIDPGWLRSIALYDGQPLAAQDLMQALRDQLRSAN